MALNLTQINLYLEKEKPITLAEIPSFGIEDLKKPEIYKRFIITIANPEYEVLPKIALPFIDSLNKLLVSLSRNYPDEPILEKYREIIRYLQFYHLYFQKLTIIKNLFENYLLFALKSEIDIKGQLQKLFIFYNYDMSDWVDVRELILRSLRENKEKIGEEKIKIKELEVVPIIKNWLLDYEPFRKEGRAIERANYVAKSENFKKLKEEEKKILMQVLEIYDYLQFDLNWYIAAVENRLIFLPKTTSKEIISKPSLTEMSSTLIKKPSETIEKKVEPPVKPPEPKSALEKKYWEEEK